MNKFIKFMSGRYGVDELYKFLFYLYIIIFIINIFVKNNLINYIELLLIIIIFARFFSKNITKRQKENQIYLKYKNKIKQPFIKNKRNYKNHIYKKCHKCQTILRLPLPHTRGIKHTTCPTCQRKITFFTLRKEKVEIITKERKKI